MFNDNEPMLDVDAFAANLTGESPDVSEPTPESKKPSKRKTPSKQVAKTLDAIADTHKAIGAAAKKTGKKVDQANLERANLLALTAQTTKPEPPKEPAGRPVRGPKEPVAFFERRMNSWLKKHGLMPKDAVAPILTDVQVAKQTKVIEEHKVVKAEAKAAGISTMDEGGEPKTTKQLKQEITEPKVKKMVPKGTNAKRKLIREAAKDFPATFGIVDWEGHKLSVLIDASTADLDTGEVRLAVGTAEGAVAMHSPNVLKAIMVGAKAKTGGTKTGKTPKERKPHVKGERKSESNIPMMMRLLLEGKTQDEIFKTFRDNYMSQNVEHKNEAWTWDRVVIYHKIAFGKLSKDERAKVKTTEINKPGKGERKAKPAKADKPKTEGKKAEAKPAEKKEKAPKEPKEPKPDGASKAARKAKRAEREAALQAKIAAEIKKGEDALKAALARPGTDPAKVAGVVAATRELAAIKVANTKCVACSGTGKSSKGQSCTPCGGKGLGKAEA